MVAGQFGSGFRHEAESTHSEPRPDDTRDDLSGVLEARQRHGRDVQDDRPLASAEVERHLVREFVRPGVDIPKFVERDRLGQFLPAARRNLPAAAPQVDREVGGISRLQVIADHPLLQVDPDGPKRSRDLR